MLCLFPVVDKKYVVLEIQPAALQDPPQWVVTLQQQWQQMAEKSMYQG